MKTHRPWIVSGAAMLFALAVGACSSNPSAEGEGDAAGDEDVGDDGGGEVDPGDDGGPGGPAPATCSQPEDVGTEGCDCFPTQTCGAADLVCDTGKCVRPLNGLPFGAECEENGECRGDWCIQPLAGGAQRCSGVCNEDCPEGWDCRNFTVGGGDQTFVCVPPPHPCTPCTIDNDCGGSPYKCLSAWLGLFCGTECGADEACSEGFLCTTFGLPAPGCIPATQCPVDDTGDDLDEDGIQNADDNCATIINPGQEDRDNDGLGDVCDNCPGDNNPGQQDHNNDGIGNPCDPTYVPHVLDARRTRFDGSGTNVTEPAGVSLSVSVGGLPGGRPDGEKMRSTGDEGPTLSLELRILGR